MLITVKIYDVRILGRENEPHLQAVGYLPGGQVLIVGHIFAGHSPSCQWRAVEDIRSWLEKNRYGWKVETPGEGVLPHDSFKAGA